MLVMITLRIVMVMIPKTKNIVMMIVILIVMHCDVITLFCVATSVTDCKQRD